MIDEIEKKLLKEIEYFALHPERVGYNISIVNEWKARLEQHQETKKWIEGLIGKCENYDGAVIIVELKELISGEKG